jgi:hypothetical protein
MVKKKNIISLTTEERETLGQLTTTGKAPAYKMNHARILLKADTKQEGGGWTDKAISQALDCSSSWLNMAETELSVLAHQCLDRRIPDQASLQRETLAWEQRRNTQLRTIDWRFTTEDARIRLKRLYPSFQP